MDISGEFDVPIDYYPMLAGTGSESDLGKLCWRYEPKLDGVRCLAYITNEVKLFSRVGKDMSHSFPDVVEQLKPLAIEGGHTARYVLDGEIVAGPSFFHDDALGSKVVTAKFQALQHRLQRKTGVLDAAADVPARFIAFDVIEYAGLDVTYKHYNARRLLLATLEREGLAVIPAYGHTNSLKLYEWAVAQGCEGFMAKNESGRYEPSRRSKNWLKIKPWLSLSCYCIGATHGYGRRGDSFGALVLLEQMFDGTLVYVGQAGTGFNDASLKDLTNRLESAKLPTLAALAVLPRKVRQEMAYTCNLFSVKIKYQERTKDNILRFPVFVSYE